MRKFTISNFKSSTYALTLYVGKEIIPEDWILQNERFGGEFFEQTVLAFHPDHSPNKF